MRFKVLTICFFIFVFLCFWKILHPPKIKGRSLDINVINVSSRNPTNQIIVEIKNVSKNKVTYDVGRTVCISFLHDGRWETNDIGHFFIEEVYLGPNFSHQFTNYTKIPAGTTAVKVGITYISLTWRGNYALKLSEKGKFTWISELLGGLDASKRSATEWTGTLPLSDSLAAKGL